MALDLPNRYLCNGVTYSGGQAEVYVCHDVFLDREVAIKHYFSVDDRDEFLQEVKCLSGMDSIHVAELFDLVPSTDGLPGIVQEYVPGPELSDFASTNPSTSEYVRALYQVASGIADLHRNQLVHRDIKPHNMRFDSEGIVKILDFGLSSSMEMEEETFASRGTFGFRAPEFYNPPPVSLTYEMDVYAFGATAWFMATGGLPAPMLETPPLSSGSAPSVATVRPDIPENIAAIVDRCLEKTPNRRPRIADVVHTIKQSILHGQHRAELVAAGARHVLSSPGQLVRLHAAHFGELLVGYDGLRFFVKSVNGDAYINNCGAVEGQDIPDSCVLTLGPPEAGPSRVFVSFNVSHPEVVL